jgi:hypothetical protein
VKMSARTAFGGKLCSREVVHAGVECLCKSCVCGRELRSQVAGCLCGCDFVRAHADLSGVFFENTVLHEP